MHCCTEEHTAEVSRPVMAGKEVREKKRKTGGGEPWSVFLLTQRKVERNEGFMVRGHGEVISRLREKNASVKLEQTEKEGRKRSRT